MLRRRQPVTAPSEESFQRLVQEHAARLYRVAYAVVRDPHLAEDVVQDTIVKAWQNQATFRGDGSFGSWMSAIAHRTAVSYLRRSRETAHDPHAFDSAGLERDDARNPDSADDKAQAISAVMYAIDELDEISKQIVLLRHFDGLSYSEIAQALALPLPTVKSRLLRARRSLQRAVTKQHTQEMKVGDDVGS